MPGPGVVGELALHQVRNAAGELHHLEPALDVALGVDKGLAVLGGEQPREIVVFRLHQLQELEHHAGAALRVGCGPGRLGGGGVGDGLLDLGLAGERDLGLHLAGVRIEHVAGPPGRALDGLAADEMADIAHDFLLRTLIRPGPFAPPGGKRLLTRQIPHASARVKPGGAYAANNKCRAKW